MTRDECERGVLEEVGAATRVGKLKRAELDGCKSRTRGFAGESHACRAFTRSLKLRRELGGLSRGLLGEPRLFRGESGGLLRRRGGSPRTRTAASSSSSSSRRVIELDLGCGGKFVSERLSLLHGLILQSRRSAPQRYWRSLDNAAAAVTASSVSVSASTSAARESLPQSLRFRARRVVVSSAKLLEHRGDVLDELIATFLQRVLDPAGEVLEGVLVQTGEDFPARRRDLVLGRHHECGVVWCGVSCDDVRSFLV